VRRFLPTFFETFPDIRYSVEDVIAEGDRVMIRLAANGTQRKDPRHSAGGAETGQPHRDFIFRIADRKIAEGWRMVDLAGLQKRLRGTQSLADKLLGVV
jgi:predicted ester cyclase